MAISTNGLNGLGLLRSLGLILLVALGSLGPAHAGQQSEEALAVYVRTALSAAVSNRSPPMPQFFTEQARAHYWQWFQTMRQRLPSSSLSQQARDELLQTVWYESQRSGLDTALVLGLIQVESGFRKYAISPAGARGYMQVMPFWTRVIGDGDDSKLFHMQANLRFGCVILRHYLNLEKGDLFMALGRYNGSRGRPEYPTLVLKARERFVNAQAE